MRLSFFTVQDLLKVRGELQPIINKNKATESERESHIIIEEAKSVFSKSKINFQ